MKTPLVTASLTFRFLVAVDIEGFSRRSAAEQAKIQDDLDCAMSKAAAEAGLHRKAWYRQPGGDGELAVLPSGASGLSLVSDYPRSLALMLAELNDQVHPGSRLRIRMAIHHGTVSPGRFGPVGSGPITVCRLVDSRVLRQTLKERADLDIALIVSAAVYDEVVQSGFHELDPKVFHRTRVGVKGTYFTGYLCESIFARDPGVCVTAARFTGTSVEPTPRVKPLPQTAAS